MVEEGEGNVGSTQRSGKKEMKEEGRKVEKKKERRKGIKTDRR